MHNPPSVPSLLAELSLFANNVFRRLSPDNVDWHWRPKRGEWSLAEVLCHLRDVELEVHQVRFRSLMAAENVFLSGENPDVWVEERQYRLQDGRKALEDFVDARAQTVSLLEGVRDESTWERTSRHALFGLTSMHELLNLAVRHDRAHWEQITELLRERE
jgi:hypothetical protein